jgi:hypothetical protein
LREEHRLRVLRRIFEPERDKVRGQWRKPCSEEHNELYSSPNFIRVTKLRRMRWDGHVVCVGERRRVYKVLVGKPEGWGGMDWICLAQDRNR